MKSPDGLYVNEAFGMKSESLLAAGAKSNGSTRLAFGRYCRRGRERYSNRRPPTVSVSVSTMSNDASPKIAFSVTRARKSGGEGTSVAACVDLVGCSIITKKQIMNT